MMSVNGGTIPRDRPQDDHESIRPVVELGGNWLYRQQWRKCIEMLDLERVKGDEHYCGP